MTTEDYDNMIAVLRHAKEGGMVEFNRKAVGESWHTTTPDGLMWNFEDFVYRPYVEPPKPMECWVVFTHGGRIDTFWTELEAKEFARRGKPSNAYCLMRQVGEYIKVAGG